MECRARLSVILMILWSALSVNLWGQIPERVYGSKFREADRLLEMAKKELQNQNYQQALELLNGCLQYQSDQVEAYFNRAMVKEHLDDAPGAFTDYQIVLLLDSTFREAAFNRAKLRYKQGQYQRAIADFEKVLTMGSSGTQMLYFKGTPLNSDGQIPLQAITTTHSMEADIYNYLGLCYHGLKDYPSAVNLFDRAITISPTDANFLINRGLSYAAQNQPDKAIADFRRALEFRPDDPIAQFNLTQELEASGNLEIKAYDEIIEGNPEFASAYVNRALARINAQDLDGALEDYNKAISISPDDPVLYLNRGLALEKSGEIRSALADFNLAVKLDPGNPAALRSRGRVLFALGEFSLALDDLNESIALNPDFGGAYFNRALVHRKLGNDQATCADLKQAQILGISNAGKALAVYCSDAQ